jgi:putative redox protein
MRPVIVQSAAEAGLAVDAQIGEHRLRFDEPVDTAGGTDTGAEPPEVLLAALGACEAITMKMYAARKGWALAHVRVQLSASRVDGVYVVSRQLEIDGNLDEAQRARLIEIANRCPIHRILMNEVRVEDVDPATVDAPR